MSIGFFIWFIVTLAIGGFFWWGIRLQMLQKKAWQAFAEKYDLQFTPNKFYQAPSLEGFFSDYYIRVYEGQESDLGGRQRSSLFLELDLRHGFPMVLLVMKRDQQDVFKALAMDGRLQFDKEGWQKTNLIGTNDQEFASSYLFEERLLALQKVFDLPDIKPAFFTGQERSYFILQHDKPITDPRILNRIFKTLSEAAYILEVPDFIDGRLSPAPQAEEIPEEEKPINEEEPDSSPGEKTEPEGPQSESGPVAEAEPKSSEQS